MKLKTISSELKKLGIKNLLNDNRIYIKGQKNNSDDPITELLKLLYRLVSKKKILTGEDARKIIHLTERYRDQLLLPFKPKPKPTKQDEQQRAMKPRKNKEFIERLMSRASKNRGMKG